MNKLHEDYDGVHLDHDQWHTDTDGPEAAHETPRHSNEALLLHLKYVGEGIYDLDGKRYHSIGRFLVPEEDTPRHPSRVAMEKDLEDLERAYRNLDDENCDCQRLLREVSEDNASLEEANEILRTEIARLQAGGCARDQRLTQHCAEAAQAIRECDEARRYAEERKDMIECTEDMSLRNMHQLAQEGCRFFYLRPKAAREVE